MQSINSVGIYTLFKRSYLQLRKQITRQNTNEEPNVEASSNFQFHDYLPGQFLIGRIWCLKNLYKFLENTQSLFEVCNQARVIHFSEYLDQNVASALWGMPQKYLYSDVDDSVAEKNTRFIKEAVDELLIHETSLTT